MTNQMTISDCGMPIAVQVALMLENEFKRRLETHVDQMDQEPVTQAEFDAVAQKVLSDYNSRIVMMPGNA